jgi:hypothetical protein
MGILLLAKTGASALLNGIRRQTEFVTLERDAIWRNQRRQSRA